MIQTITNQDLKQNEKQRQQQLAQSRGIGSGYTNVQRFNQANINNRLGQALTQGIGNVTNETQKKLQQGQQQFQQSAQAGRLDTAANVQARQNILNKYGVGSGDLSQDVSDEELRQFERFRSGQYTGAQGLQNEQELLGRSQELQNIQNLIGSQGGRLALLQRFIGGNRGGYTFGQQNLDQLLLSTNRQNQQALSQGLQQAGLGQQNIQRGIDTARLLAEQYAQRAKEFGEETKSRISETDKALTDYLTQQMERQKEYATLRRDIAKQLLDYGIKGRDLKLQQGGTEDMGTLTQDFQTLKQQFGDEKTKEIILNAKQLEVLGIPKDIAFVQGIQNAFKLATDEDLKSASLATTASLSDYIKKNALARLAGLQGASGFEDKSLAGQYLKQTETKFDKEKVDPIKQKFITDMLMNTPIGKELSDAVRTQEKARLINPLAPDYYGTDEWDRISKYDLYYWLPFSQRPSLPFSTLKQAFDIRDQHLRNAMNYMFQQGLRPNFEKLKAPYDYHFKLLDKYSTDPMGAYGYLRRGFSSNESDYKESPFLKSIIDSFINRFQEIPEGEE
jgi:hypothetical protein